MQLILQEVIGFTAKNANGLASDASSEKCVYVAGCVAVVYDAVLGAQSHLVVSHRAPKPLSCVAVSRDGRFVAAGESGNQPSVLVWDSANPTLVSELKGHLYGVACIAFSPDGKHLVSVGGYIYLWDWQGAQLVTKLKASSSCSSITSVTFSLDAKHIVTAGSKHLKLWSLGFSPRTRFKREMDTVVMQGKPINPGPEKGNSFVAVASPFPIGHQLVHVYALTEAGCLFKSSITGTLCVVQSGSIIKSLDLKVEKGFALSVSEELVACACSSGLVKLVSVGQLECAGVLSYPTGKQCQSHRDDACTNSYEKKFRHRAGLPDAVACQFLTSKKIAVVYGDHSLYIWDIHDVDKATRCCMLVSHTTSIWDIKNLCCENLHNPAVACTARGCSGGISFATCSADGTIRLWDFVSHPELSTDTAYCQSAGSKLVGKSNLVSSGIFERDTIEPGTLNGFRSLAVSSDGEFLAAGDSNGNLHIYSLQSSDYLCLEGAHDAEILSLDFNLFNKKDTVSRVNDGNHLLTSGGRDRVIHVYDVKRNFELVQSIVDHSAAVTSVKLTADGHKLVSCSADRSLVVRDVFLTKGNYSTSRCHHQIASSGTVYDMVLDPSMDVAVTVGQDKKINVFDIASGQLMRSFKPNKDYGDPIKVTMDPSCSYLVCSYSNKSICMYDFVSGEMVTQAMGHGEVITGVIFLPDCRHIVSVGGDGCIFVWKLPTHLSSRMLQAITEKSDPLAPGSLDKPETFTRIVEFEDEQLGMNTGEMLLCNFSRTRGMFCLEEGGQGNSNFKFRISLLPKWAQAKVDTQSSDVPSQNLHISCYGRRDCNGYPQGHGLTPWERSLAYDYKLHQRSICEVQENAFTSLDMSKEYGIFDGLVHDHAAEKLHADQMENELQERADVHTTCTKLEETELFKEHFGNLSAAHKIERQESSARKRYSSRFFVRRNYIGDWKKFVGSPGQNFGHKNLYCPKESKNLPSYPILEDSAVKVTKNLETAESYDQPLENPMANLMDVSSREGEVQEKIKKCSEALLSLENAAEATSRLFSELLAVVSQDEFSSGPSSRLFNNAADCLPSIVEKVNELATLVRANGENAYGRPHAKASVVSKQ
ncbi:hypothetical protein CDL15_Pgr007787 [Punica granatum]|uniref:Mitogen-activated protein kinase-binding protein 1 n=1 Tax=Punica granatum TaxID=22663 RepID=A0A218XAM6_PUNGR|nr:hypothetical protein CDL15_Pgr007787 [Punica granatum]